MLGYQVVNESRCGFKGTLSIVLLMRLFKQRLTAQEKCSLMNQQGCNIDIKYTFKRGNVKKGQKEGKQPSEWSRAALLTLLCELYLFHFIAVSVCFPRCPGTGRGEAHVSVPQRGCPAYIKHALLLLREQKGKQCHQVRFPRIPWQILLKSKARNKGWEKSTQGATSGTKEAFAGIGSQSGPGGEVCLDVAAAY